MRGVKKLPEIIETYHSRPSEYRQVPARLHKERKRCKSEREPRLYCAAWRRIAVYQSPPRSIEFA